MTRLLLLLRVCCWLRERDLHLLGLGGFLLAALALVGEESGVDVWKNTTLGNGDTGEELVELIILAHGELDVAWVDALLVVVACGVASELEDLSCEVLKDGCQVHWGTSTNACGEVAALEVTVDTSNWELETSAGCA